MKPTFVAICIILTMTSCSMKFTEPNDLALPPFFKEDYKELHEK
jgi:hypothetical protein